MVKTKEKEEEKEKEKKMLVGLTWNCPAELKIIVSAFIFLCLLATLAFQFLPSRFSSLSTSDLRLCVSELSSSSNLSSPPSLSVVLPPPPPPPPPPDYSSSSSIIKQQKQEDEVLNGGIIKRAFNPYGSAAYNFIEMGSYRGGLNTFAIIGFASKPIHVYGKPYYQCQWIPDDTNQSTVNSTFASKILPDWGYGRVYTVVVINCTFPNPVGVGGDGGGRLVLYAFTGGEADTNLDSTDKIEALREAPNSLNPSIFTSPPVYDYLYCGSSLYGNLSPQRLREWIAYHVKLFGEKSHFVIHDAGGVHPDVLEVLKPWMEKGYVTLQDIKEQERFDGYYHNQFLVVNDCLHRYRFMAKWIFFFDVDEFIYVPPKTTIKSVVDGFSDYTQFTIEQTTMSNKLCLANDADKNLRKWGFEKLVYKDVKKRVRKDRKYAVQPRNVFAAGVHMSQNIAGKTQHKIYGKIRYYHYHGTIAGRREPCQKFINDTRLTFEGTPYVLDTALRDVAASVKKFELKMIGSRLQRTRQ